MNPNPLSRTSRLIVPVGIPRLLGRACPKSPKYQVSFQPPGAENRETKPPRFSDVPAVSSIDRMEMHRACTNPKAFVNGRALFRRHGDGGAQAGHRVVEIVANLQRQLVFPRRELQVEFRLRLSEMDP